MQSNMDTVINIICKVYIVSDYDGYTFAADREPSSSSNSALPNMQDRGKKYK